MKKIVTIIKTRDGEEFILDMPIKNYMAIRNEHIAQGKKTIFLKEHSYDLTITNVLSSRERKQMIAIEAPKDPKYLFELGSTEKKQLQQKNPDKYYQMERAEAENRAKIKKITAEQMEKSKPRRAKQFIKDRAEDLKRLAERERYFGLTTTNQKILEWEKFTREKKIAEAREKK